LTAADLKPYLQRCGYKGDLLRVDYPVPEAGTIPLVGFARVPLDARSACIATVDAVLPLEELVSRHRRVGAPIVLVCHRGAMQWWRQGPQEPRYLEQVTPGELEGFFDSHRADFAPEAVYRAKTWGRLDKQYQLTFVDAGLMPVLESQAGEALGGLIARTISALKSQLGWHSLTAAQDDWLVKSVFWLLSAKILHDKEVPKFIDIDLTAVEDVFHRVAAHYGTQTDVRVANSRQGQALRVGAETIARFSDLRLLTTESLAYIYENVLVSRETRKALGTHSTPSYLVDYIIGKLANWIEEIPPETRNAFEPACGHAAFLIGAIRLLGDLLPYRVGPASVRHNYLRKRLHGCEIDPFALEIAKLSLTLADVPNPNGWDLEHVDMFEGDVLSKGLKATTILLSNPPFEDFTTREKQRCRARGVELRHRNKAAEMLSRALPALPPGAVFGVVVPQGFLHSRNAADVRERILGEVELLDICLFPDNIFKFSDMESAVIIGRKTRKKSQTTGLLDYRIVRRHDVERFRQNYSVSFKRRVAQSRFSADEDWNMRVAELDDVWSSCRQKETLGHLAKVGQGLFYKGASTLPPGAVTISAHRFPGAKMGFAAWQQEILIHELPRAVWMSLDPSVVDRPVTGAAAGIPQVLLNYAPVSRGPWRLKALLDREGHPVTNRFLTVRPLREDVPLEYLWALCNSPLANAFAYTQSGKRDNLAGMIRKIPAPVASAADTENVVETVLRYFSAVGPSLESRRNEAVPTATKNLLLHVDAQVLRLYDLPPRIERQLLDFFTGWQRGGVSFPFEQYYPDDFEPCFPLHEYISEAYQRSTAGYLRGQKAGDLPRGLLGAIEYAAKAFGD